MKFSGKVLIVDDEPHIRKYVSTILKQLGQPAIAEAADGEAAIAAYETNRPDLVLLDVNMPFMTGIDTLRRLREIDSEPVIVMLTSLTNRQTVEQSLTLGADNYIRKDTPREEIMQALTEIVTASFGDPTNSPQ